MSNPIYIAHSATPGNPDGQALKDHLRATGEIAAAFFKEKEEPETPLQRIARTLGYCHDAGKYAFEVQRHILTGSRDRPVHATLGGQLLTDAYRFLGKMLAFAVLGHHGGMPDGIGERSLEARLNDERDSDAVCAFFSENALPDRLDMPNLQVTRGSRPYEFSMLLRMMYSALVDADYLDTERYFQPEVSRSRGQYPALRELFPRYESHMRRIAEKAMDTEVNRRRASVLAECIAAGKLPPGIFTLTVPTGGGKTLASLGFALTHALEHPHFRRIIYAIPFTSIIEQNAKVFREAVGTDAVLEHHSAVAIKDDEHGTSRLAAENWDAPLIVTTNVQLFESLYAASPAKCRKVHNLRDSIIILDEAQALPNGMLKPCLMALRSLALNWGATVVLMTATQPELSRVWPEPVEAREIIQDIPALFDALRRTKPEYVGRLSDEELCARLRDERKVLAVVNSRRHAQKLYKMLSAEEGVYHLSALMCPVHRANRLEEIRKRLNDSGNLRCIVISTSLVEAGVDLDFPCVYRALAGLDSIVQAAGRCNRNGLLPGLGKVVVFRSVDAPAPAEIVRLGDAFLEIADCYKDLISKPALDHYFRLCFGRGEDLDEKNILRAIAEQDRDGKFPFRTIADNFEMIKSAGEPLLIPYDNEARELLAALERAEHPGKLLRKLQPYGVTVYPWQMRELVKRGFVRAIGDARALDVAAEQMEKLYSEECGLNVDSDPELAGLFG